MAKSKITLGLVALLVIALAGVGYKVTRNNVVAGGDNGDVLVEEELGATPGTSILINDVEYGASLSAPLKFVAAATTTPGGLFKILNSGTDKVCGVVEVDVTDGTATAGGSGTGNAMAFSVSTSTSATAFSTKAGGIIASTTIATSTAGLFTNISNAGSYIGGDQDVGGERWVWGKGVWLLGAFDDRSKSSGGGDYSTGTGAYLGMAGRVYVDCHVQNK